ncbi:MAG: hypothetical protein ACI4PU_03305 [Intestinibacter sp.]
MPRPTGTGQKANIAKDLIEGNIETTSKKYRKEIVFDRDMKHILEREAAKRGMNVTSFIKYCVMKEINLK